MEYIKRNPKGTVDIVGGVDIAKRYTLEEVARTGEHVINSKHWFDRMFPGGAAEAEQWAKENGLTFIENTEKERYEFLKMTALF